MEIERRWERKREAGADAENHLFYASLCVTDKAHRKVMLINRSRDEQSYRPLSSEIEKKRKKEMKLRREREKDWNEVKKGENELQLSVCVTVIMRRKTWISDFLLVYYDVTILSLFAHPQVVPNPENILSSVENIYSRYSNLDHHSRLWKMLQLKTSTLKTFKYSKNALKPRKSFNWARKITYIILKWLQSSKYMATRN